MCPQNLPQSVYLNWHALALELVLDWLITSHVISRTAPDSTAQSPTLRSGASSIWPRTVARLQVMWQVFPRVGCPHHTHRVTPGSRFRLYSTAWYGVCVVCVWERERAVCRMCVQLLYVGLLGCSSFFGDFSWPCFFDCLFDWLAWFWFCWLGFLFFMNSVF